MELDNERIGERLRNLRKLHGLKQKEVSEYLGISQGHYSNIERGACRIRYMYLVHKLSLLYNCSDEYILCLDDNYDVNKSILYNNNKQKRIL